MSRELGRWVREAVGFSGHDVGMMWEGWEVLGGSIGQWIWVFYRGEALLRIETH